MIKIKNVTLRELLFSLESHQLAKINRNWARMDIEKAPIAGNLSKLPPAGKNIDDKISKFLAREISVNEQDTQGNTKNNKRIKSKKSSRI